MGIKKIWHWVLPAAILLGSFGAHVWVQAQVCKPNKADSVQVTLQYYRRLSVDLRGYLPSPEEAAAVAKSGKIPEGTVEAWTKSDDFYSQLREYHRNLLWANLQTIDFRNNWELNRGDGTKTPLWNRYHSGPRGSEVSCLDEPVAYNKDGSYVMKPDSSDPAIKREGYVMVKPYWNPEIEIKVCALDALGQYNMQDPEACSKSYKTGCGCGPNLRWCQANSFGTQKMFTKALAEQSLHMLEDLVRNNKPYTDVMQSKDVVLNGTISHLFQHQLHTLQSLRTNADMNLKVPSIKFMESKWQTVQGGKYQAGILTAPLYLLKFSSNRSRANHFYENFLCKPFQAPPGGLPPGNDPCHAEPDLTKRCGCKYCHQTLEPASAYWGRWMQPGLGFLDPSKYPIDNPACSSPNARFNSNCSEYFTRANHIKEEQYRGKLRAYLFASNKVGQNIELGPSGIAKEAIDSGNFAACTTKKVWSWFVGTPALTQEALEELANKFSDSNYNFRTLIQTIVQHPSYKLGRLYQISYTSKK
ncbi:MAG: hypothetical protein EP343_34195 [Deltaproteobacteria bacterium]|nr:MAG: hypothetical protein EP343_34195 [Deltaproteobacteria bacterium]